MPGLTMFVGPPGSGKTTAAVDYMKRTNGNSVYVNQDSQGAGHMDIFDRAIEDNRNIVVDRMNHTKKQRNRFLSKARAKGYSTQIIVLHVPKDECLRRCALREGHETIKSEEDANKAIHSFFKLYDRVEDGEADVVEREGWKSEDATKCVVCDLDGTLANIDHRLHHAKRSSIEEPDWKSFHENMVYDRVNEWCSELITMMSDRYPIVYITGRPENYREHTQEWLYMHHLTPAGHRLLMREVGDHRPDYTVKQNILDFEIKTRYNVLFAVEDRQQAVDMWRNNGCTVLQCAKGDF